MSTRSTQARRLARHLAETTGADVDLVYDTGAKWHLNWVDGPTRDQMREHLAAALAGPAYPDMRDRQISTSRSTSPRAWATRAVHARRDGLLARTMTEGAAWRRANLPQWSQGTSDLTPEDHAILSYIEDVLDATPYPDRADTPEDDPAIAQLLDEGARISRTGRASEYTMVKALRAELTAPRPTADGPALRAVPAPAPAPREEQPPADQQTPGRTLRPEAVDGLARHAETVVLPAMLTPPGAPEPLAAAAWQMSIAYSRIAELLGDLEPERRAELAQDLAERFRMAQHEAHSYQAGQQAPLELAARTDEHLLDLLGDQGIISQATVSLTLPIGRSITVHLGRAHSHPGRGWTTVESDSPLLSTALDGTDHLDLEGALTTIAEVLTRHLKPPAFER